MTWVTLQPELSGKPGSAQVSVTINKSSGRFRQRMLLTIRSETVARLGAWCHPGAPVQIEVGSGEHAGSLRITQHGPWKFRANSGRIKGVALSMPPPPNAPKDGCQQMPVGFTHEPGVLTLTMPKWSRAADAAPPARTEPIPDAARAASIPARMAGHNGTRFVSITDRVPDPVLALQAASPSRVR